MELSSYPFPPVIVLSIPTTIESDWDTASAVHRALTTEELQRSIFASLPSDLSRWSVQKNAKRDLVSVALTCQAFTEVALDILYHDVRLEDLLPVWHARDILRRVITPSTKFQEIVFNRAPNPSEYQRMTYYSRRVRILDVQCEWWAEGPYIRYGTNFFPTFIEVITNRSTNRAELFPQLQSLNWSGAGEVELVSCEAIIQASPRLKDFEHGEYRDELPASADSWPTLLRTLASAQSLEKVNLDVPTLGPIGPGTRAGLALSCLITKPNVKELELPGYVVISTVVMSSFASARQLERLTFFIWRESITSAAAELPLTASLDRLSYLAGPPGAMKSILAGPFVFRALTSLNTGYIDPSFTWSFVRNFFDLVGNGCPVIETLLFSGWVDRGPFDQGTHFVLAPLRACTRMQRFRLHIMAQHGDTITVPQDFNPTDLDWRYLISEWLDLHQMSYHFSGHPEHACDYYRRLDPKPRATIKTFTEFSRRCRQLGSLLVPLTVTSHDTDAALQDDILPFGSSLYFINFLNYSIEDDAVEGLALLLLRLTRDDVEFHLGDWLDMYIDDLEKAGLDMRSERNWRAAKKHIDFTRRARPMGPPPTSSGSRDMFGID